MFAQTNPPVTTTLSPTTFLIAFIIAFVMILLITLVMVRALVNQGNVPSPNNLIIALSVLTLLAIVGGLATSNDEAWTIAAAGIGALAGSVTAMFQESKRNPKGDDENGPGGNGSSSGDDSSGDTWGA